MGDEKRRWFDAAVRDDAATLGQLAPRLARTRDAVGNTALIYAASRGNRRAVSVLQPYEKGCRGARNITALIAAVLALAHESDALYAVISALAGAEARAHDASGNTALIIAARQGWNRAVQILARHEAKEVGEQGRTALMNCAVANNFEGAKILEPLEAGLADKAGMTALMFAAHMGSDRIVQLLAPREAGMANARGEPAIVIAINRVNSSCARVLVPYEGGLSYSGKGVLEYARQQENHACLDAMLGALGRTRPPSSAAVEEVARKVGAVDMQSSLAQFSGGAGPGGQGGEPAGLGGSRGPGDQAGFAASMGPQIPGQEMAGASRGVGGLEGPGGGFAGEAGNACRDQQVGPESSRFPPNSGGPQAAPGAQALGSSTQRPFPGDGLEGGSGGGYGGGSGGPDATGAPSSRPLLRGAPFSSQGPAPVRIPQAYLDEIHERLYQTLREQLLSELSDTLMERLSSALKTSLKASLSSTIANTLKIELGAYVDDLIPSAVSGELDRRVQEAVEGATSRTFAQFTGKIADLRTSVGDTHARVRSLDASLAALKEDLAALGPSPFQELQGIRQAQKEGARTLASLGGTCDKLRSSVTELAAGIAEVKEALADRAPRVALDECMQRANDCLRTAREALRNTQDRTTDLQGLQKEVSAIREGLQSRAAQSAGEIPELRASLARLEHAVRVIAEAPQPEAPEYLGDAIQELGGRVDGLQARVDEISLSGAIQEMKQKIQMLRDDLDQARRGLLSYPAVPPSVSVPVVITQDEVVKAEQELMGILQEQLRAGGR